MPYADLARRREAAARYMRQMRDRRCPPDTLAVRAADMLGRYREVAGDAAAKVLAKGAIGQGVPKAKPAPPKVVEPDVRQFELEAYIAEQPPLRRE